jgi:hypothetical protein
VLLLARLVLGLSYSAIIPLGEAPDEADHYAYAAYIGREGRLPVGPEMTQAKHPPLYYLLAAAVAKAAGAEMDFTFLRSNPDVGVIPGAAAPNFFIHTRLEAWPWSDGALAMHVGRLVSVVAGLVLTAATYALGRTIWPSWYAGPLAAAAFVAFLPESLFIGGSMSNDMLAAMWSALALWLGLRARRTGVALLAGVTMGLAFLTKASTVGLWPVVCASMVVDRPSIMDDGRSTSQGRGPGAPNGAAIRAILAGVVASAIAIPWLWRNWRLYGDPLGLPLVLATIDRRQGPLSLGDLWALVRGWIVSFWGKTGGAGQLALPWLFYLVWGVLLVVAAAGLWLGWRRREASLLREVRPSGWVVLLGAPAMTVLSILAYSRVALGTDQGRLLFPALAPVALLLVLGVAGWLSPRAARWLPAGFGGGMALVAVLALVTGIVLPYAAPPAPAPAEVASAAPMDQTFGGALELLAYRWEAATGADSTASSSERNARSLVLYWRAAQPTGEDLRTVLSVHDPAGNLLWEWKRSPGAGRFSTDRWQAGRVVQDMYEIPAEALDRAERVELGVRPFPDGSWLAPGTASAGRPLLVIAKPSS